MRVLNVINLPKLSTLPSAGNFGNIVILETDGLVYFDNGVDWVPMSSNGAKRIFTFGIKGTDTGDRGDTTVAAPFDCKIVGWKISTDTTQSCVFDIKKNGASICAASKPTLVTGVFSAHANLTAWDVDIAENDVLKVEVESKDNVGLALLQLIVIT